VLVIKLVWWALLHYLTNSYTLKKLFFLLPAVYNLSNAAEIKSFFGLHFLQLDDYLENRDILWFEMILFKKL